MVCTPLGVNVCLGRDMTALILAYLRINCRTHFVGSHANTPSGMTIANSPLGSRIFMALSIKRHSVLSTL